MKYKGFTISFANIDANRMYRTESATVGTYWPTRRPLRADLYAPRLTSYIIHLYIYIIEPFKN